MSKSFQLQLINNTFIITWKLLNQREKNMRMISTSQTPRWVLGRATGGVGGRDESFWQAVLRGGKHPDTKNQQKIEKIKEETHERDQKDAVSPQLIQEMKLHSDSFHYIFHDVFSLPLVYPGGNHLTILSHWFRGTRDLFYRLLLATLRHFSFVIIPARTAERSQTSRVCWANVGFLT